jgi:hypothetical protein
MTLNEYFKKLRENDISFSEYIILRTQCLRLVKKACSRYKINDILHNKTLKTEIFNNICSNSLVKSLKGYNKDKGSFSTYFYYKACSSARSEVGKLKRRIKINNTLSLDEKRI